MYKIKSPVLFTIFNRPDTTYQVFQKIRAGQPAKLYIAADGPRADRDGEADLCKEARKLIQIDWDCEVHTLYRTENMGCKVAMSGAVKWFFQNEEEGIVLEDDCLPGESFFYFCDTLLEKYRNDTRVGHIGGAHLSLNKKFGDASYYFSKYTLIWGWASWRRVWQNYDEDLVLLDEFIKQNLFKDVYERKEVTERIINTLKSVKDKTIVTWDYQYVFTNFWNNSLCIAPNVNLITNIGFDKRATHTSDSRSKFANLPAETLTEITHPKFFVPMIEADYHLMNLEEPPLRTKIRRRIAPVVKKLINLPFSGLLS